MFFFFNSLPHYNVMYDFFICQRFSQNSINLIGPLLLFPLSNQRDTYFGRKKTEFDQHTEQSTENERIFALKTNHICTLSIELSARLARSTVRMFVCVWIFVRVCDFSNNFKMLQIDCLRLDDNVSVSLFFTISLVCFLCSFVPSLFRFVDETNLFLN